MIKCLKILLSIIAVVCAVGSNLSDIQAAEYRLHEAHEHGVAHMNVTFEENELYIEIRKKHEEDKHHRQENHESDKHERHSEFRAEYHCVCKKPEKLASVDVMLFSVFSGIEHIEVQLLTVTKKTALELTAKKKKIIF